MYRPHFHMLVGIPGSGKTTNGKYIANAIGNSVHISSDSIREELYGDPSIQGEPSEVFSLMHERTLEALSKGVNVVYDATNVTRRDRASILSKLPTYVYVGCTVVWAPIEMCIERDAKRERSVGKDVIDKMVKRFQAPYYDEGFDNIVIVRPPSFDTIAYANHIANSIDIPHDNPHHNLPVNLHCDAAADYLAGQTSGLRVAASLHDIGKGYTKAFKDTKGNDTEIAHYYQHQNVGAWQSYGIHGVTPYIAWLISTHMDPFFNTKYYKNLPEFLKKDVDLLHEADLNAH